MVTLNKQLCLKPVPVDDVKSYSSKGCLQFELGNSLNGSLSMLMWSVLENTICKKVHHIFTNHIIKGAIDWASGLEGWECYLDMPTENP